ncbi:tRNA (adenosine(37)-N6)-threonylcarbamoyltransferase complex dimerization subunit type 1 TsaB [candidate division WOR-3 bacterium]|nr:tRNA (adenosine(37)-N6)-threonylcarbamoyltransferase complex dimerization subunit type 1 TsaB [candidate division WOR-3 bacterium]
MSPELYLGIETSGRATGIALVKAGTVVIEQTTGETMRHDELLIALLDQTLKSITARPQDLAGIGVTVGPGMFSSLRVGLSAAKGLALALSIPLKGVNTLWALARSVPESGAGGKEGDRQGCQEPDLPVLAAIDARKSQVYAALYRGDSVLIEPGLFACPEIAQLAGSYGARLVGAGSGVELCRKELEALGIGLVHSGIENPLPRVIALEAARALARGAADDLERLEPNYLRRTDAELARESGPAGS